MTIACIVIASENRRQLVLDKVLPSVVSQAFDEVVVAADWAEPDARVRWLTVEPLLHNTTDALVKRDVGTLATTSDILVYLCDDHALVPNFERAVREVADEPWDVIVPNRYTKWGGTIIPLNSGASGGYCGGHAGVFRRQLIQLLPWSAGPHDRLWDLNMSVCQQSMGARFVWLPRSDIAVEDLEPEREPWK